MGEDDKEFSVPKELSKKSRRSNFFQKRLSLYSDSTSFLGSTNASDACKDDIKLNQYISKLQNERDSWKMCVKKLQKENSTLKEKKSLQVVNNTWDWEFLAEEDKQFLQERPDYTSVSRLLDSTLEVVALRQRRITLTESKLQNLILEHCQTLNLATASIIQHTMENFDEFQITT